MNPEILKFNPTPTSPIHIIYSEVLENKFLKPDGMGTKEPIKTETTKRIRNNGTILKKPSELFESEADLLLK